LAGVLVDPRVGAVVFPKLKDISTRFSALLTEKREERDFKKPKKPKQTEGASRSFVT
jgi:hypothetical protein